MGCLEDFIEEYQDFKAKDKIDIKCCICGKLQTSTKEKVKNTIARISYYRCRSCGLKQSHADGKISTVEAKAKISKSHTGKRLSASAKSKISLAKQEYWLTEAGEERKKELSMQMSNKWMVNSPSKHHIRTYHKSPKNEKEVACASSYELKACYLLDENPLVLSYDTQVMFQKSNGRSGFIDFIVNLKCGQKLCIEIKPYKRLGEEQIKEQIAATKEFATKNEFYFEIWTENELGGSEKELTYWAKEIVSSRGNIDIIERDRQRKNATQRRYYANTLSKDKTTVFCEFCNEEHTILTMKYNDNVKKNGRYICIYENGVIQGKATKGKNVKINPYAEQELKECNFCHEVLPYSMFDKDKAKSDGFYTICKLCRKAKKS